MASDFSAKEDIYMEKICNSETKLFKADEDRVKLKRDCLLVRENGHKQCFKKLHCLYKDIPFCGGDVKVSEE